MLVERCGLEYGLGGGALGVRGRGVGGVPPVLAARLGTGGALGVRVPGVDGWLGVGGGARLAWRARALSRRACHQETILGGSRRAAVLAARLGTGANAIRSHLIELISWRARARSRWLASIGGGARLLGVGGR